jgi:hypothetical protein
MPDVESGDEWSPKQDAIDRFERMVDVQVQTLNEIDTKAAELMRLLAVLLGVVLTGLSLIPEFKTLALEVDSVPLVVAAAIGVGGLLSSLGFAIITYLSSRFGYGVSPGVAEYVANNDVPGDEYAGIMLRGYADIIPENREVVQANSRRFRNALTALLVALASLVLAVLYVVADIGLAAEVVLLAGGYTAVTVVVGYILSGGYLIRSPQTHDNE